MERNRHGFFLIILFIIIMVLIFPGCRGNEEARETVEETVSEATKTSTDETLTETETTPAEDTSIQEDAAEETGTETLNGDLITFKTSKVNENTAVMILEVNIETGEITGIIQMGFKGFDMNMNSTKICDYVLTGRITGELDTETRDIRGELEGRAETDTKSSDCKSYDVIYEMFASISEDFSRINYNVKGNAFKRKAIW